MTAALARCRVARILSLDYRLAPEHPFPAALDDAVAAVVALFDAGLNPQAMAIAGDSAGGGLALATLLALRDRGVQCPACAWLISPWTDLTRSGDSKASDPRDPILTAASLARSAAAYAGGRDLDDMFISPARARLEGVPPLLVQVGSREILIDDALAIARAAALAHVPLTLQVLPDMLHSYVLCADADDAAMRHLRDAVRWIVARCET